jgi:hypothetical protein
MMSRVDLSNAPSDWAAVAEADPIYENENS